MNKFQENLKSGDWIYLKEKYKYLTNYCRMTVNKGYKFLGFGECDKCFRYKDKICKGRYIIEGGNSACGFCGDVDSDSSIFGIFEDFIKEEEFSI